MKILGVIPARFSSTRLPGKPLADICGKPMIWWVYQQARQVAQLADILVATENLEIAEYCQDNSINYLMTSKDCPNHIHRIYEVSQDISADYYVSINGDEPLIEPHCIETALPDTLFQLEPYFLGIYRVLTELSEIQDSSNVKIVLDLLGNCLYQSRAPIPVRKNGISQQSKKAIGVECFNKEALDFFAHAPMGRLEEIEDIDHLRFLENGIRLQYREVRSDSFSVDTPSDLERARAMISKLYSSQIAKEEYE